MPVLERRIAIRGPRFFTEDGELMFVNHLDGSTREGPRKATESDIEAHPKAFAERDGPGQDAPGKPMISADGHGRPPERQVRPKTRAPV